MFIRIGIRKTRNTDDSWFRDETFITFFKFRFSTWGERERETQFFYADCSSIISSQLTDSTNAHTPQSTNWTGLAQVRKINLLHLSPNHNSLLFFKFTKNPSPSLLGMTSFTSPVPFLSGVFIMKSVIVKCARAREHLH